ncbi:RHS repeat-associated protein [Methylopila jiangsuensis]|uniref:RHS repeat-associated core domain-containing protein n=1 Tax=Methylopila jiangsuensis TaxID=586230 RepID=UPI0022F3112B|nr:RHS repeat-associated core domain-containing protein [Methylopila jiangsuensis]MDR6284021.1 RHS repeat-associated protein [Methylopila jiangsuensis]
MAVVNAAAGASGLYYVHVDHLDRPALMTDASKAVVWRASYEAFGAVRSITGPASLDLRFPGQWFQLEAGLAYNWNRHYDPTLGRYTQPDPLGFVDGPNVYGYVNGNPVLYADPSGEYVWIIFGAALGAGAEALNQYMECGEVYNLKSILVQGAVGGAASVMGGLGAINALGLGGRTAYGAYNGAKFGAIGAGLAGGGLASGGVGGAIGGAVGASVEGFLPAGYGIGRALGGLADAIASTGASNALSGGGNECKCKN